MDKRKDAAAAAVADEIVRRRNSEDPDEYDAIAASVCADSEVNDRAVKLVNAADSDR